MVFENLPEILTVKELANLIKVHEITIKRAIKNGNLKAFKATRDWRISREEALKWLNTK